MNLRSWLAMLFVLLLASLLSNKLDAQTTTTGGLTGIVTDPSGAVVPDAIVELKDNAKGDTQLTRTNAEGTYLYSFLRPGSFTLTVAHPGFKVTSRVLDVALGPPATQKREGSGVWYFLHNYDVGVPPTSFFEDGSREHLL